MFSCRARQKENLYNINSMDDFDLPVGMCVCVWVSQFSWVFVLIESYWGTELKSREERKKRDPTERETVSVNFLLISSLVSPPQSAVTTVNLLDKCFFFVCFRIGLAWLCVVNFLDLFCCENSESIIFAVSLLLLSSALVLLLLLAPFENRNENKSDELIGFGVERCVFVSSGCCCRKWHFQQVNKQYLCAHTFSVVCISQFTAKKNFPIHTNTTTTTTAISLRVCFAFWCDEMWNWTIRTRVCVQ